MKTGLPRLLILSSVIAASFVWMASGAHAATSLLSYWNFNNDSPAYNSGAGQLGSFNATAASYGEAYTTTNTATVSGTLAGNTSNSTVFHGSAIKIDFSNIDTIAARTINGKKWNGAGAQAATSDQAGFGTFSSSATNNVGSDTAGNSLLLLNTSGNMVNKYITFSLSSAGYDTLSLSYATRLTNAVTSSQVWSYSLTENGTYTTLATISPTANGTWINESLDLSTLSSSFLNNQSAFYLRMTYTSANTQGSQAIDNIQLTGVAAAIPEPSTYALLGGLGALGCAMVRRKRR